MDFQMQVARMIRFVDQEGDERTMELLLHGEEEANLLYNTTLSKGKQQVEMTYAKTKEKINRNKSIEASKVLNEARMKVLHQKQLRLEALFGEAYYKLVQDIQDKDFYRQLFGKLVLQALCMVMEKNVGIQILERDKNLIKQVIPSVVDDFEKMSHIRVRFQVDGRVFLPKDCLGGVVMYANRGRVKVENTLAARLSHARLGVQAFVRYTLFGINPRRKHFE